jgi:acetyltransferase-like isoleucine patch superfamily enzyme
VVTKGEVPPGAVMVGVPARPLARKSAPARKSKPKARRGA